VLVAIGYVVIAWLASALWAFVDMRRRSVNPIWPYASAGAVVLASPLLFPLALLVHVVVRPASSVAERRVGRLRDSALMAEVDQPRCTHCRRPIDEGWLLCPTCRASLAHQCEGCGHVVGLDWDLCPWCGSMFGPPSGAIATR
jgi:RNA polymerase subunit RPABC4/transcription elongation factor Spt4